MFGKFNKAKQMQKGYARLKVGMSKSEVIEMLGQPTGQRTANGTETLTWKNSEFKGWARGGTMTRSITVDFVNGIVTGYDGENIDRSRW